MSRLNLGPNFLAACTFWPFLGPLVLRHEYSLLAFWRFHIEQLLKLDLLVKVDSAEHQVQPWLLLLKFRLRWRTQLRLAGLRPRLGGMDLYR